MSTEKIDEQLIDFLQKHPEYFSGEKDEGRIRADLRSSFEQYARAIDPVAYECLSKRVLEFQAHARSQMKKRMAELVKEKELQSRQLREVEEEFEAFEEKIRQLGEEMKQYRLHEQGSESTNVKGSGRDFVSILFDVIGIVFLYAGFILSERVDYGLVFIGCIFLAAGFWLHRGGREKVSSQSTLSSELCERIQKRYDQVQAVWKLKKLSLLERKKESIQKIELIDREILKNLQGIRLNSE